MKLQNKAFSDLLKDNVFRSYTKARRASADLSAADVLQLKITTIRWFTRLYAKR